MQLQRLPVLFVLLSMMAAPSCAQDPSATTAPAMPTLSKDQQKLLGDKNTRKQYEACAGQTGDAAAGACLGAAVAAHDRLHDAQIESLANQRACAFGNPIGCATYGKFQAAAGDVAGARKLWTAGPCAQNDACKTELFWSYANAAPPDGAQAVPLGTPLCREKDDDRVCRRLIEIGAPLDYNAVLADRRQRFTLDLISRVGKSDMAIPALQGQVSLNEANVNMQSGFSQLLARGTLKLAQAELNSELKNNANLHAQLDACNSGGPCGPQPSGPPPQFQAAR